MITHQTMIKSVLLLFVLTLGACDSFLTSTTPVATEPDLVSTRIAQAAEKASNALNAISSIEQQRTPLQAAEDYSGAPPNMTQPITIKWTGPIEQITQMLASRAGLSFRTVGRPPMVPIAVNVNAYQQPLIGVLRDIGLQAGQRADMSVNGQAGFIEIRYASIEK